MTRRSKRELSKAVDELREEDRAKTIYDWLDQWVISQLASGDIEITIDPTPVPDDEVIAYVATDGEKFGVPPEDLPAWIEIDDLPIHGREDRPQPIHHC